MVLNIPNIFGSLFPFYSAYKTLGTKTFIENLSHSLCNKISKSCYRFVHKETSNSLFYYNRTQIIICSNVFIIFHISSVICGFSKNIIKKWLIDYSANGVTGFVTGPGIVTRDRLVLHWGYRAVTPVQLLYKLYICYLACFICQTEKQEHKNKI